MLSLAFGLLLLAALLGGLLAVLHLRAPRPAMASWPIGIVHGLFGIIGLIALTMSHNDPQRGAATGVAEFGRIAVALLALSVVAALLLVLARLRHRTLPGIAIGVHATLAISGVVILAAYTLLG